MYTYIIMHTILNILSTNIIVCNTYIVYLNTVLKKQTENLEFVFVLLKWRSYEVQDHRRRAKTTMLLYPYYIPSVQVNCDHEGAYAGR